MHRAKDCQAGADFDKEHPTPGATRKRAGGNYGQALCASQAAGPAVAALNQFSESVRSYARVIGVPPEVVDVVAPLPDDPGHRNHCG